MLIAKIRDPRAPGAINAYAIDREYKILELKTESKFPQLLPMILELIQYAREQGCREICFLEIRQEFSIILDEITWKLTMIGFRPKE